MITSEKIRDLQNRFFMATEGEINALVDEVAELEREIVTLREQRGNMVAALEGRYLYHAAADLTDARARAEECELAHVFVLFEHAYGVSVRQVLEEAGLSPFDMSRGGEQTKAALAEAAKERSA